MAFRRKRDLIAAAALFLLVILTLSSTARHSDASSWRLHGKHNIAGHRPYVKPSPLQWTTPFPTLTTANWNATQTPPPSPLSPASATPDRDRVLVVAKLEGEDVSWLTKSFPTWQLAEYTVSSPFALLHHSGAIVDKGRIANAYLTYLIENYYALPSTLVFLTPHRNPAASPRSSSSSNQKPISLGKYPQLTTLNELHVQKVGYANLRCASRSTCLHTILPFRAPPDEYRTLEVAMPKAWAELFPDVAVPEKLAAPCCAEFAVSRDQVRKRGLDEYMRFWEWLNKTKMDDETAGLVMEALWHVVFGQGAVDCEDQVERCECDVYGRC